MFAESFTTSCEHEAAKFHPTLWNNVFPPLARENAEKNTRCEKRAFIRLVGFLKTQTRQVALQCHETYTKHSSDELSLLRWREQKQIYKGVVAWMNGLSSRTTCLGSARCSINFRISRRTVGISQILYDISRTVQIFQGSHTTHHIT